MDTKRKYKLGLIGYPLSHSFSPTYFSQKFQELKLFDSEYLAYPIEEVHLVENIFRAGVQGINVTIPYKEKILPYLDELSNEAFEINAVNTILIKDGRKIGYNTDVYGFEKSLLALLREAQVERAIVLGTGGASKAVNFVLKKLGITATSVSRKKPSMTYADLNSEIVKRHKLIVNTTPVGMYPAVTDCPKIPYEGIGDKHFLYDLVYNPEKSIFLQNGEMRGASIKNGYDMLILQAEKSWEIWNQQ